MQKHNFDVIEKLSEENINNKTYLEELICTISELISKNKNVKNIKNKKYCNKKNKGIKIYN